MGDDELIGLRVQGTLLEGKGQITNGMIEFNNVISFYQLKNLLEEYTNDSLKVSEAYTELGYDTLFDKDAHITDFPVLEKFEKSLNFISARKNEETMFFNFLNQGHEPQDFDKHWINDPFLKSLLNANNEIKIGSRIIKHIDSEHILMVGNGDFNTFNNLKNLPVAGIEPQYNARILKMSEFADEDYFTFDNNGEKSGHTPIKEVDFEVIQINDSVFSFVNYSFIDYGDTPFTPQYTWTFSNGYTYVGFVPPNYTLRDTLVSVKLKARGRDLETIEGLEEARIAECFHTFEVTRTGECTVSYISEFDFGPNAIYQWDFGDGSVIGSGESFTHTYSQPGTYMITGYVYEIIEGIRSLRCILQAEVKGACCVIPITDDLITIDGGNVMFKIYSLAGISQAHPIGIKWGEHFNSEIVYYPSFSFASYNYKKSGEYTIEVTYYDATGKPYCWGEITISIIVCNEQGDDEDERDKYIDGRWYRLYCYIWVSKATPYQNFTAGAYSKTLRKGNISGIWWNYKVDKIWCRTGGYYLQRKYEGNPAKYKCIKIDVTYDEIREENSGFVGREELGDNYKEPVKFWSTHRAQHKGVEWSFPGKFYLP